MLLFLKNCRSNDICWEKGNGCIRFWRCWYFSLNRNQEKWKVLYYCRFQFILIRRSWCDMNVAEESCACIYACEYYFSKSQDGPWFLKLPVLIFRLRSIVAMLITSDWCSLNFFSALQKHFCSHIEACACTQIHKPKERRREIFLLFTRIFFSQGTSNNSTLFYQWTCLQNVQLKLLKYMWESYRSSCNIFSNILFNFLHIFCFIIRNISFLILLFWAH